MNKYVFSVLEIGKKRLNNRFLKKEHIKLEVKKVKNKIYYISKI